MFRSPLFAAAGLIALVSTVSAQPLPTTKIIAGYIVSTDATAKTIQVKTGIDTQTYTLADNVKLESGKAAIQAADLAGATGQRTTLWYTVNGDSRLVTRVKVDQNKGAAAAKVATPATTAVTPE